MYARARRPMLAVIVTIIALCVWPEAGEARGGDPGAPSAGVAEWLPPATSAGRTALYRRWRATPSSRIETAGALVWDCPMCPQMVVVPPGEVLIGTPNDEPGRGADESPQRVVRLSKPFQVGRFEVTRGEYEAFLTRTKRAVQGGCVTDRAKKGEWAPYPAANLRDPGFAQDDRHPVVCVTWSDAKAYVAWLNSNTRGGYRLLSEAEWEYVARAGSHAAYPWGADAGGGCRDANGADQTIGDLYPTWNVAGCRDGAIHTSAVGSYRANRFGLFDLIGNVGEWLEDCATLSYEALPDDGSPNMTGDCARRIVRSGSWGSQVKDYRVGNRIRYPIGQVDDSIGIRVARTLRP